MIEKIRQNKVIKYICAFTDGSFYPLVLGFVVLLCHIFKLEIAAFAFIALSVSFTNLFADDTRAAIPAVFTVVLAVAPRNSMYDMAAAFMNPATVGVLAVIVGLIVITALVRLFVNREAHLMFRKTRLVLGFAVFSAALLLSGLFSVYYGLDSMLLSLSLILTGLVFYLFFSATVKHRDDNLSYLAKSCAVAAGVIVLELLWFYITHYEWGIPLSEDWKNRIFVGWGISNVIGELLAFLLPAVFYLVYKERHGWAYYILTAAITAAACFTLSRNAIMVSLPIFVAGTVFCLIKGKRKLPLAVTAGSLFVLFVVALAVMGVTGKLEILTKYFADVKLSDRGRFSLWKSFLELFKEYPLFGAGFSAFGNIESSSMKLAHNTVFQLLGSCGIVGLGAYLYHRYETVKLFVVKPTAERTFFGVALLSYIIMGLLDPIMVYANFFIYYTVILVVAEKDVMYTQKQIAGGGNRSIPFSARQ